ncbi:hypothetical protein Q1695_004957 [Nippostrongylus brasiliensis]|nr:hypothetical protein Q1695_004957 [Nippostrongylus brasiliensis]
MGLHASVLIFGLLIVPHCKTFEVFWNVPSRPCEKAGINIPLEDFEIKHNSGQLFAGEKIVIFYEYKFGKIPYYAKYKPDQPINGGLPQNCSLEEHLEMVRKHITVTIPDKNFDGIAVIDLEEWRPLYDMNWGVKRVYQKQSKMFVTERFPSLSYNEVVAKAREEFDKAARAFVVRTVEEARNLRPLARWGYYGFPFCNTDAGKDETDYNCSDWARQYNDRLNFIYKISDVLYPSIYLNGKTPEDQNLRFVQAVLNEARRVAEKQVPPRKFYAYTKFEYNPYKYWDAFYQKQDLCNSMKIPFDFGASGLILWSTSKSMRGRCKEIAGYVRKTLGPTLQYIRESAEMCHEQRCSRGGDCVLLSQPSRCTMLIDPSEYECRCYDDHTGENCTGY